MVVERKPPRVLAAHRSGEDAFHNEYDANTMPTRNGPQVFDEPNPFRLGAYEMDVVPSDRQRAALDRIYGDRILLAIGGHGYVWQRGPGRLTAYLVESLIDNQWIIRPGYPLFSGPQAGTLTVRGEHARLRLRNPNPLPRS